MTMKEARKAYKQMGKDDDLWQQCQHKECGIKTTKMLLDRHHPQGKKTPITILIYFYLCRGCHDRVHANPAWAESLGLLKRNRT